jgi:hypothetical protein
LLAAFAPQGARGLSPREGEVHYLAAYEKLVAGAAPLAAFGLRAAVWLFALSPIWHLGRARSISGLVEAERTALLRALLRHQTHVVRELTLLLKYAAALALLGTPSIRARSGYDAPPADAVRMTANVHHHLPLLDRPSRRPSVAPQPAMTREAS